MNTDDEKTASVNKKKKKYRCKYRVSWETDEQFRSFVQKSQKGVYFFYCSFCQCHVSVENRGSADVIRHQATQKHVKLERERSSQMTLKQLPLVSSATKLKTQVKMAEIKFAAFMAEHNLPFNTASHASDLFSSMFPDSKIASQFSSKKTKTSAIIKNVLGETSSLEVVSILREKKFSIIIDESTDRETVKHLCVVARYYDSTASKIRDRFLTLLKVESFDHQAIYGRLRDYFKEQNIPYETNCVGFAADGASVMFGKTNSVYQLLKKDVPHLFGITCVCHSFAIIASNACQELPRFIEDMARDIYNYLKCSTKRLGAFKVQQDVCMVKPHKILRPGQTRWLSLEAVVKRILEQYEPLTLFFEKEASEQKLLAPATILNWLKDPQTKIFLQFLEFVLPIFNKLNRLFQSETILIDTVYESVLNLYKDIISLYMKPEFVKQAETVQPANPHTFVKAEDVYLGANVAISLKAVNLQLQTFIRTRSTNFLVKAASEIRRKFNFLNDTGSVLQQLTLLKPKNVFNCPSLSPLLAHFPFLHPNLIQNIDSEYRTLKNYQGILDTEQPFEEFWISVSKLKFGNDFRFPNLCNFIFDYIFDLPHSSANVERLFNIINNNKSKSRMCLNSESLNGILHTKELMKYKPCYSLQVTQDMMNRFTENMYDFKQKTDDFNHPESDSDG